MRARLIGHCEQVTIEPIDRTNLLVDDMADEVYSAIKRTAPIVLTAQIEEVRRNGRAPSQAGAQLPTMFRLTFLTRDVQGANWSPADGDRITQIADVKGNNPRSLNLYITAPRFEGKTLCGNELIVVDAVSRQSREQNEGLFG